MLYQRPDGDLERVEPAPPPRVVTDRLIGGLHELGHPVTEIAVILNCSRGHVYNRLRAIKAAADRIPEGDIICLDGKVGWVPQDELRGHHGPCPRCRGVVVPGSTWCCLSCLHSGIDDRLEAERRRDVQAEAARLADRRRRRAAK